MARATPSRSRAKTATPRKPKGNNKTIEPRPSPSVPGIDPHLRPPPSPPPKIDAQQIVKELEGAAATLRARAWDGKVPVTASPVEGVPLLVVSHSTPRPYWHLLTSGLWTKGFELSLRVPRAAEEGAPPAWATEVLAATLRQHADGAAMEPGQALRLPSPFTPDTDMQAVALAVDPKIGAAETEHARLTVLSVVGLCRDEERLAREWSPLGLSQVLAQFDPLLMTDPERQSLMSSPRARTAIEQRAAQEGSSLHTAWTLVSAFAKAGDAITWRLSTEAVELLIGLLKGRTGFLRPFTLRSPDGQVEVAPADAPRSNLTNSTLSLQLPHTAAKAIRSTVRPAPGTYKVPELPMMTFEVSK